LIYLGIYRETKLLRYWATQQQNEDPIHPFTRFISRNRFQLLLRRLRIFDTSNQSDGPGLGRAQAEALMPDVYRKVNEWSAYIQETGDSFYTAGTDITVDEAMVRFTGRSFEIITVPTKPIPTGYKIWILA
ncbi:hypothetical protein CI238_13016, partial [Colletotrichum incanum]